MVNEPDEAAAIAILRGLKERYENHHKVRIRDEAIIAAVTLSGATSPTDSFPTRPLTSSTRQLRNSVSKSTPYLRLLTKSSVS